MTAKEAIEDLAKNRVVEGLLEKFGPNVPLSDREDIAQMVYVALLTSKEVPGVVERGKLKDYVGGLAYKMLRGKNADYRRIFHNKNNTELTLQIIETTPND